MVKVITVATHSDGYLPWLEKSCERFNINLIKLGYGQKWLGFSWRLKLIIDYLKSIDPNELVIFIDAYDIIVLRPLDDIEEYYNDIIKKTNNKIIIGYDKSKNIFYEQFMKFYFGSYNGFRINAGSYLGKASDILEILNKLKFNDDDDDQKLFTSYFNKNPDDIYIDINNIFFLISTNKLNNILNDKNIKIKNNELTYKKSKPFFIHGSGNTYMHDLILKLGYKITTKEITDIIYKYNNTVNNKKIYYLKETINKYKFYIIIILIFLIYFFIKKSKNIKIIK
jgi:hypothetical protein